MAISSAFFIIPAVSLFCSLFSQVIGSTFGAALEEVCVVPRIGRTPTEVKSVMAFNYPLCVGGSSENNLLRVVCNSPNEIGFFAMGLGLLEGFERMPMFSILPTRPRSRRARGRSGCDS